MRGFFVSMALVAALALDGLAAKSQEKAPAASSTAAVLAYREAANFQNNSAFEVAAEEWQKFLQNFPKDALATKARHYLGVCQLQLKQYAAAAATLETVVKNYPRFELLEDTLFDLASCQYAMASAGDAEQYGKAAASFGELLEKFPQGKRNEEALFYLGESLYAGEKKAEAASAYERLVKEFPKSARRADALYALGVAQEELGRHAQAGTTYDLFLTEFGGSRLASDVKLRKGETLLQAGDLAEAEALFGQLASKQDFEQADHALSRQAYCLSKLQRHEAAGTAYARLASEHAQSPHSADAAISAGRCFYRANNADSARQWLETAMARRDGNSTEAAYWLCRVLIKAGLAADAAKIAQQELPASKGTFAANLKIAAADALYEIPDRRVESLESYVAFVREHPRHELTPQALYHAAFTALGLKQYAEGQKHAHRFLEDFAKHELAADVLYVAAECQLQLNDYDSAAQSYQQLVQRHPDHADADAWRVRRGLVAHLQKNHKAVLTALTPVVDQLKSKDARAEAQFLIGASQFYLNRYAPAVQSLTASLKSNPKWRQADEASLLLARAQAKEGQASDAKVNLQRFFAEHPTSRFLDEAHYRLGELYADRADHTAAAGEFKVVATQFGDSQYAPYALYGKGWAEFKSKAFADGVESFTALITRFPEHQLTTDATFGRALCRRQAGDANGTLVDLDAYLKTNPDRTRRSDAHYEKGLAQVALKDFAAAVATLDGLLDADPKYAGADKVLYEIGWALKSQGKHADAAARFANLAERNPASKFAAEAWFHVGEEHYEQKRYADAKKAYANVKAKQPEGELVEKASYKLGWANFQLKDYADALLQFREELADFPRGPLAADATFMQAECLFRQENYAAAWPAYQAALAVKPSTPTIESLTVLHAGQSAGQLKKWNECVEVLSQLAAKQPDSPLLAEALYELGWAKQNLGRSDEALADYEAAATKSRDHVGARARFMRGELLLAEKKHDEASRDFQRAMYGYGGDQASAETKNWQAKSGYEAGRCAELQLAAAGDALQRLKHLTNAQKFYSFVTDKHAGHELATEAKKRLDSLEGHERQRRNKGK